MNHSNRLEHPSANRVPPIALLSASMETPEMIDLHKKVNGAAAVALFILAATATTALTVAALPIALVGAGTVVGLAAAGYALKTSRTVNHQMVQREKIIRIANEHLSDPEFPESIDRILGYKLNEALEAHVITQEEYSSVVQDSLKNKDFDTFLSMYGSQDNAKPFLKQAWILYLSSEAPLKLRNVTVDELMSINTKYNLGFTDDEMKDIRHKFAASALAIFKEKGEIPGMKEKIYSRGVAEFDNLEMYEELLNYVPLHDEEIVKFVQDQLIKRLNRNAFSPGSEIRRCWEEDKEYLKDNTNLNVEQRDFILLECFKIGVIRRVHNYLVEDGADFKYFRQLFTNVVVPIQIRLKKIDDVFTYIFYIDRTDNKYYSKPVTFPIDLIVTLMEPAQWDQVVQKFLLGIEADKYRASKGNNRFQDFEIDQLTLEVFQPDFLKTNRHLFFKEFLFNRLVTEYKDDFFASIEKHKNGAEYREKAVNWYNQLRRRRNEVELNLIFSLLKNGILTLDTKIPSDTGQERFFATEVADRIESFLSPLNNKGFAETVGDCFYEQILTKEKNSKDEPIQRLQLNGGYDGPAHEILAGMEFKHLFSSPRKLNKNEVTGEIESFDLPSLNQQDRLPNDQYYVRVESFSSDSFKEALKRAREEFAVLSEDPNWFKDNAKWEKALQIYDVLDRANDMRRHKHR